MNALSAALIAIALLPGAAAAQDKPDLVELVRTIDGKDFSSSGRIGLMKSLGIYFQPQHGPSLRAEMAVDRPTLEAVEACEVKGYGEPDDGCAADVTGAIRLDGTQITVLIDSVSNLTPPAKE